MSTTILETKLSIPPLQARLVPRDRLVEQIEQGWRAGRPLTLVAAPAGFGKTTLINRWARRTQQPVAWFSLEEDDNEAITFWVYLLTALDRIQPGLGAASLKVLRSGEPPPTKQLLIDLVNELAALSRPLTLVLDDYHVIENQEIHTVMRFLLDHPPGQFHLVIATRADPPFSLARLRGQRRLTELRENDLRFTLDDTEQYLNQVMGLGISRQDIENLEARTEGWVVGLCLAAQSMQDLPDKPAFIRAFTGSHHYVLEYLMEEVLNRQPESVRAFLLSTAILTTFSASLCEAVTGDPQSEAILDELRHANLFIIPLDSELRWFRYHQLFSDLLGELRRKNYSDARVRELHRRASRWYAASGKEDEAIKHALRSDDLELATDLIARNAGAALSQGRLKTLLNWVQALPQDLLDSQPRLRLQQAWALHLSGETDSARRLLQEASRDFQELPASQEKRTLQVELASLLAGVANLDEKPSQSIRQARDAIDAIPEDELSARARAYISLGTAHAYNDDLKKAELHWSQANDLALAAGNPFIAAAASELIAGTQIYHLGRLRKGAAVLRQIIQLGTSSDGSLLPFTATAHALLAEVHLEWNELESARSYLDTGLELMQHGGIRYGLIHACCTLARLERALGNREAARTALLKAEDALDANTFTHTLLHLIACQVRVNIWLGNLDSARRWVDGDPLLIGRAYPIDLPVYLREVQQAARARLLLASAQPKPALQLLEPLVAATHNAGRGALVVEAGLLQALAFKMLANQPNALLALKRCLEAAKPEGYLRLFLEAGEPLRELMLAARSQGWRGRPVKQVLDELERSKASPPETPGASKPVEAPVEALTAREMQVLKLIGAGYSNQMIAATLVVSLNTVKKHTSNIYAKLDVRNRAQAIVRASQLKLL